MQIEYDIPYREAGDYDPSLNTLDIYFNPFAGCNPKRTIVVFIHGGSWSAGDKACFPEPLEQSMPAWFVHRGYVFVAINFRLAGSPRSPVARVSDMASDIAKAIKWLTVNGRRFGGRASGFVLIGHSSGAHLAALVATHQRFLQAHRLSAGHLRGVVAIDIPHFDVPLALQVLETEDIGLPDQALRRAALYSLFGAQRVEQDQVSPAAALGSWLSQTAFLLVSAGWQLGQRQTFTQRMSEHFQNRLSAHGIQAALCHVDDGEHVDLVQRWGGALAVRVEQFLDEIRTGISMKEAAPGHVRRRI